MVAARLSPVLRPPPSGVTPVLATPEMWGDARISMAEAASHAWFRQAPEKPGQKGDAAPPTSPAATADSEVAAPRAADAAACQAGGAQIVGDCTVDSGDLPPTVHPSPPLRPSSDAAPPQPPLRASSDAAPAAASLAAAPAAAPDARFQATLRGCECRGRCPHTLGREGQADASCSS